MQKKVEVLLLGVRQAQASAAATAVDGAFQVVVVVVAAFLLAGQVLRFEHGLHTLVCLDVDQRLVAAGVLDAVEGDDPGVVGVVQALRA